MVLTLWVLSLGCDSMRAGFASDSARTLAQIIHNPKRKRGTGNKIPRLLVGLRKAVCIQLLFVMPAAQK